MCSTLEGQLYLLAPLHVRLYYRSLGYGNEMVPAHQYLKGLLSFQTTLLCSVINYVK